MFFLLYPSTVGWQQADRPAQDSLWIKKKYKLNIQTKFTKKNFKKICKITNQEKKITSSFCISKKSYHLNQNSVLKIFKGQQKIGENYIYFQILNLIFFC